MIVSHLALKTYDFAFCGVKIHDDYTVLWKDPTDCDTCELLRAVVVMNCGSRMTLDNPLAPFAWELFEKQRALPAVQYLAHWLIGKAPPTRPARSPDEQIKNTAFSRWVALGGPEYVMPYARDGASIQKYRCPNCFIPAPSKTDWACAVCGTVLTEIPW